MLDESEKGMKLCLCLISRPLSKKVLDLVVQWTQIETIQERARAIYTYRLFQITSKMELLPANDLYCHSISIVDKCCERGSEGYVDVKDLEARAQTGAHLTSISCLYNAFFRTNNVVNSYRP